MTILDRCLPPEPFPEPVPAPGKPLRKWLPVERRTLTVGLDLGQSVDPSAIAIIEKRIRIEIDWVHGRSVHQPRERELGYAVRHLERLPLGMSYVDQAARVAEMLQRPELEQAKLVIDMSGVGRAIYDLFKANGLKPIGVTIVAGDAEAREGNCWRVGKLRLISGLQARLHDGSLKIAKQMDEARILTQELQDFRMNMTERGAITFGARSGRHDDLLLSTAVGLWWASRKGDRVGHLPLAVG